MRSIIRTSTNKIVTGVAQGCLVVSGTVDMRANRNRRMRILYQHATQALARLLAAFERHVKPALALAPASTGLDAGLATPRCWQRKASQHPSAIQSRG
jgi:hypothetical protein